MHSPRVRLVQFGQCASRENIAFADIASGFKVVVEQNMPMTHDYRLHILGHDVQIETAKVLPVEQKLCASEWFEKNCQEVLIS